jgi:glycerol uptake facilitator-like aquaporin
MAGRRLPRPVQSAPGVIFEVVATFLFLVCILGVTQMFKPGGVLAADNA